MISLRELARRAALVLGALVAMALVLEVMLWWGEPPEPPDDDPPAFRKLDGPIVYGLDPAHPGINALGLLDDPVAVPKPFGVTRILVLGDSIAFGVGLPRSEAFPDRLERRLSRADTRGSVEVVNAGVPGYTPWNELHYFLGPGRELEPDVVLVAFCINDVANPRLHWGYTSEEIIDIPEGAIPNADHDRRHIQPRLARRGDHFHPLESRVHLGARKRLRALRERFGTPRMLTGEDDVIGIEVLLGDTPEWRWLVEIYERLRAAVAADGATFAIALFPVAYQLDPAYPHHPQQRLADHCRAAGIACLDLLPVFRGRDPAELFLLDRSGFYDIWHLTAEGHALATDALERFLADEVLSTRAVRGPGARSAPRVLP